MIEGDEIEVLGKNTFLMENQKTDDENLQLA